MYSKEQLLVEAKKLRMCKENIDALSMCEDKVEMINLYKKTIDWALENNYPTLEVLSKEFSMFEKEGLYVEHHFTGEHLIEQQVYVFHNCTGTITVGLNIEKKIIPMLYFSNNCNMEVICVDEGVIVPLYIFGDNNISTYSESMCNFSIYKH